MPAEVLNTTALNLPQERQEVKTDAREFCNEFIEITDFMRRSTAKILKVRPEDLSAGIISGVVGSAEAMSFLRAVDEVISSQTMQEFIEQEFTGSGSSTAMLRNEQWRSYMVGLARAGMIGGLIDGLLDGGRIAPHEKRTYKSFLLHLNHSFRELADSELGLTRTGLRELLDVAYGSASDPRSGQLAEKLEVGIAAEIATKHYIEQIGPELGISIQYGTIEEDSKKIDVMCMQGHKRLGIDVKSSDKNSGPGGEPRPKHTPIEEYDLGEYRVRELYPAKESNIGDDFGIKAGGYKRVIEELLEEFSRLP